MLIRKVILLSKKKPYANNNNKTNALKSLRIYVTPDTLVNIHYHLLPAGSSHTVKWEESVGAFSAFFNFRVYVGSLNLMTTLLTT